MGFSPRWDLKRVLNPYIPREVLSRFPKLRPNFSFCRFLAKGCLGACIVTAVYFATRRYTLQCLISRYQKYFHASPYKLEIETFAYHAIKDDSFFLKPIEDPAPFPDSDSGFEDSNPKPPPFSYRPPVNKDVTEPIKSPDFPGWSNVPSAHPSQVHSPEVPAKMSPIHFVRPQDPKDRLAFSHTSPLFVDISAAAGADFHVSGLLSPKSPASGVGVDPAALSAALYEISSQPSKTPESKVSQDQPSPKTVPTPSPPAEPSASPQPLDSSKLHSPASANEYASAPPNEVVCDPSNSLPELDEYSESSLMNDNSAYGPTILARDLVNMPSNEGTWTTRRRLPTAPAPPIIRQKCLITAVAAGLKISEDSVWLKLCELLPDSQLVHPNILKDGLTTDHLQLLCAALGFRAVVDSAYGAFMIGSSRNPKVVYLKHTPGHWAHSSVRIKMPPRTPTSPGGSSLVKYLSDNPGIPTRRVFQYKSNPARAKNLMSNMKNGLEGVSYRVQQPGQHRDILHLRDELVNTQPSRTVDMAMVLGFAGCGKSRPIMESIKSVGDYLIIVPTCQLRQEWLNALNLRSDKWRVSTWEVAIQKPISFVVIDEIFKLPNGYLDLVLALNPNIKSVILLGDPLQGDYHSTNPDSTNNRMLHEVDYLKPFYSTYCAYTHRLDRRVARCLGVWTSSKREGHITQGTTILKNCPALVPSKSSATLMCENSIEALTAASSQGLTYDERINIVLDKSWIRCSPQVSLVACTRSRKGIHFVKDDLCSKHYGKHPAFDAISKNQPIDYVEHFRSSLGLAQIIRHPDEIASLGPVQRATPFLQGRCPNKPSDRLELPAIKDTYVGDVVFAAPPLPEIPQIIPSLDTTHLPETRRPMHFDINCAAPEPVEISDAAASFPAFEPIYPGFNYEALLPEFQRQEAPEDLEITYRGVMSSQFPHLNVPFEASASSLSLLAPDHNGHRDPTLLPASVSKRLRFRASETPAVATPQNMLASQLLYNSYCSALHLDPNVQIPFDPMLYIDCINENEFAQLSSKTRATIMANANRSDPDWRHTVVRIFSKTQHKVNDATLFSGWKACQTLALMHDAIILTFGPVKKYQRAILSRQRTNPKIFIYAGRSPTDLSSFCQENFPPNTKRCWNDFTSFDQSQGCETTLFETLKMRRVSIPLPLIDLHLHVKTNLRCQFGPLTSMRFTGEPGTYDDNTDYNIAIANLKYDITSIGGLFSGDDSAFPVQPPARKSWEATSALFPNLMFKTETGYYATFCGYYVGSQGAVRSPKPLLVKLVAALDDGTLGDKLASYISEFAVGHSLGDSFWNLLPLDLVTYQSACFDFFCRHASRELKTMLHIGEIPLDVLSTLNIKLSRPIFSLLNRSQRIAYLKVNPSKFASWASSFLPS
nr:MAG: polyprotein [Tymoviridae sp. XZN137671]